ncbi:MAG: acyl-CoA thioesterase [Pseudomonadales bacterium]|nr:acyl-CoA thioesterase [Pseudomonadales bacterium]
MTYHPDTSTNKFLLYESRFLIRWSDIDAFGHVNNAIYFRYFEQIRADWMTELGYPLAINQLTEGPTIVDAHCQFLAQILYPCKLKLALYGGAPGRSSAQLFYELRDDKTDQLYTIGSTKMVWLDFQKGCSIPLPEKIRALLPKSIE